MNLFDLLTDRVLFILKTCIKSKNTGSSVLEFCKICSSARVGVGEREGDIDYQKKFTHLYILNY